MTANPEYHGRLVPMLEAQGRAKGLAEGRAEGRAKGRAEEAARATLTVLTARGLELSAAQRERLASCTDLEQLERWLTQAVTATSADELFG